MHKFRKIKIMKNWVLMFHPFDWMFAVFPNDEYQVSVVFCGPISIWRV